MAPGRSACASVSNVRTVFVRNGNLGPHQGQRAEVIFTPDRQCTHARGGLVVGRN